MASNANTDVDKLITFGKMALEQGWYAKAREYFEQALALDASNREAIKGLARANEILNRRMATPVEPARAEPVEPLRKVSLEPTKPEVAPAKPRRAVKPAVIVALACIAVMVFVAMYFTEPSLLILSKATPTATTAPTSTPRPEPTPRPTATLRAHEWIKCRLTAVGNNDMIQIELLLIEFEVATARLDLNAINISPRTIHVSPLSFILVDSTGASVNYTACNFRGRSSGIDLAPGTYTSGRIQFFPSIGEPRMVIYDDGLSDPITLNINLTDCVREIK